VQPYDDNTFHVDRYLARRLEQLGGLLVEDGAQATGQTIQTHTDTHRHRRQTDSQHTHLDDNDTVDVDQHLARREGQLGGLLVEDAAQATGQTTQTDTQRTDRSPPHSPR
jgi:hypothetical protein